VREVTGIVPQDTGEFDGYLKLSAEFVPMLRDLPGRGLVYVAEIHPAA
jgi:hypothetical protein